MSILQSNKFSSLLHPESLLEVLGFYSIPPTGPYSKQTGSFHYIKELPRRKLHVIYDAGSPEGVMTYAIYDDQYLSYVVRYFDTWEAARRELFHRLKVEVSPSKN